VITILFFGIMAMEVMILLRFGDSLTEDVVPFYFLAAAVIALIFVVLYALKFVSPPTQRWGWLRKNYPGVARAVQRYQQPEDIRDAYFPVLRIDQQDHFLLAFYENSPDRKIKRLVLVDDAGEVVEDLELAKKAARAKTLALTAIAPKSHNNRSSWYQSNRAAEKGLTRFFDLLHRQEQSFSKLGESAFQDYQRVLSAEGAVKDTFRSSSAQIQQEAAWVIDQRFSRLTRVSYQQVLAFESTIQEIRNPMQEALPSLEASIEPAARLVNIIKALPSRPVKHTMVEGFMAFLDLAVGMKDLEEYQLAGIKQEDLQAWESGLAQAATMKKGDQSK
jgi:hypothetical protein